MATDQPHEPIPTPRPIVLVADDSRLSRALMTKALAHRPHLTVLATGQGGEAVDLAREHRPSLILVDGWLTDMPGLEVIRHLKADPSTSRIPIVVVSADDRTAFHDEMRAAGADEFVLKPITLDQLYELVDRHVPAEPEAGGRSVI